MAIGYWSGNPKIIDLLEDQGINGRTLLRSISRKQGEICVQHKARVS
jgi:hypothetical protein